MQQLLFATNNAHKIEEMRYALKGVMEIIGLKEAGIFRDIPEPFMTLEENAETKSLTIFELTGKDCFSEDTGLEVAALNGEPGVLSARYSGPGATDASNLNLLMERMKGKQNRKARFRTVISLFLSGEQYLFEGVCDGHIAASRAGSTGFGYDPVFIPEGRSTTFAEMGLEEKNALSHRKKAADKLVSFLQQSLFQKQT